jgi:hypothetical protein
VVVASQGARYANHLADGAPTRGAKTATLEVASAMAFASNFLASTLLAGVCCALIPGVADATGTINIHQKDGSINTYSDVEIKVFSGSLFLTSDDGDGTFVITKAACSFQGKIMVCLPTAAALVQEGESRALNLKSGTVYFNDTSDAQQLSRSSAKLPPHSVMLALTLRNGVFIDLRGKIDEVVRQ